MLDVTQSELLLPRDLFAQIEHDEPPFGEAPLVEVACQLRQRALLRPGVAPELELDRVALAGCISSLGGSRCQNVGRVARDNFAHEEG